MRVFVYCEGVSMYASEVEREGAWVCDGETGGGGWEMLIWIDRLSCVRGPTRRSCAVPRLRKPKNRSANRQYSRRTGLSDDSSSRGAIEGGRGFSRDGTLPLLRRLTNTKINTTQQ